MLGLEPQHINLGVGDTVQPVTEAPRGGSSGCKTRACPGLAGGRTSLPPPTPSLSPPTPFSGLAPLWALQQLALGRVFFQGLPGWTPSFRKPGRPSCPTARLLGQESQLLPKGAPSSCSLSCSVASHPGEHPLGPPLGPALTHNPGHTAGCKGTAFSPCRRGPPSFCPLSVSCTRHPWPRAPLQPARPPAPHHSSCPVGAPCGMHSSQVFNFQ